VAPACPARDHGAKHAQRREVERKQRFAMLHASAGAAATESSLMPDGTQVTAMPRSATPPTVTRGRRARPPAVPGFATRLAILLDRLSWSRGDLARRAGVDKSVALRWASGAVVPGEASLVALTAAVREVVPGFARADWHLPEAAFAARLAPPVEPAPPPPRDAFPLLRAALCDQPEATLRRYTGTWLLLHASVQNRDRLAIVGYLAQVAPRDGALRMQAEGSVQGTWRAEGPLVPMHRLLYLALEELGQGDSMAFGVLWGAASGRAMVMDGIASSAASSLRGPAVATRMMALRLDDDPAPAWREDALRRLARLNVTGLEKQLPAPLAARFTTSAPLGPRPMVMAVPADSALACDDAEIAAGLAPEGAAAIAAARGLLGLR
jgi:hypothetical protein